MNFWENLTNPFFILAPMDDVTDTVFRQVILSTAKPDMFFTEFVNVDGLQSPGRNNLLKKLQLADSEQSLVAQIWGKDPDNFLKTAQQIADGTFAKELGLPEGVNFVGVDLNMGCPQKSEVNSGTCSALINNRPLAEEIIEATKKGLDGRMPLSVKTRIGFSAIDMSWIQFLLQQDLNMLTIHARTRKEKSRVPAHWDYFKEAVELRDNMSPRTLIVGNGDILTRAQGEALINQYGLDGAMIGRGIFNDPFLFAKESPWSDYSPEDRIELYKNHVKLFQETWTNNERPIHTLNKFCKIYISGFDGAKELREKLMSSKTADDLIDNLSSLELNTYNQAARAKLY
jgi:tRNA-dihydrouridine synthase